MSATEAMQLAKGKQMGFGVAMGSYQEPTPQHLLPQCPVLCFVPPGMHFLSKSCSSWFKKLHTSLLNGNRSRK